MKTFVMLALLSISLALPGYTQNPAPVLTGNAYEFGAFFDPSSTPRFKGIGTLVKPSGPTFITASAIFASAGKGKFTYILLGGVEHPLPVNLNKFKLLGGIQAGASVGGSTDIPISANAALFHPINKTGTVSAGVRARLLIFPNAGEVTSQAEVVLRFQPN